MSLVDDYKGGLKAASWGSAPIYPNAVWPGKVELDTPDINGLTFSLYVRSSERSNEKLFDIPFTDEVEGGKVVIYPLALGADTGDAFLNPSLWVTCQFTEDSTGNIYIVAEGRVPCGVGAIVEAPAE